MSCETLLKTFKADPNCVKQVAKVIPKSAKMAIATGIDTITPFMVTSTSDITEQFYSLVSDDVSWLASIKSEAMNRVRDQIAAMFSFSERIEDCGPLRRLIDILRETMDMATREVETLDFRAAILDSFKQVKFERMAEAKQFAEDMADCFRTL